MDYRKFYPTDAEIWASLTEEEKQESLSYARLLEEMPEEMRDWLQSHADKTYPDERGM